MDRSTSQAPVPVASSAIRGSEGSWALMVGWRMYPTALEGLLTDALVLRSIAHCHIDGFPGGGPQPDKQYVLSV